MASVATGVMRGNNVVGLQPDDRTPTDWLRMVARVFAAYRLTPLEQSIVAYVDGFHLTIESEAFPTAVIGITDGQSFVDDQFIGFHDGIDPESKVIVDINQMLVNEIYSIVLCYTWVNMMPPSIPSFDVVLQVDVDPEHMLELGTLVRNPDNSLTLTDDKRPWYMDLFMAMIGDTQIDGPGNPGSKELPYLIEVHEDETLNVGWAFDFHYQAGNQAPGGYDVRLHSDNDPASTDKNLYINGNPILTAAGENSPNDDIQDANNGGDKFTPIHSNVRLVDSSEIRDGLYTTASNSEYVHMELCTFHPGTTDASGKWPGYTFASHGSKLSHWHREHETHLINYYDFDCPTCIINDFRLGPTPGDVTINGDTILTENSIHTVFFVGDFPSPPSDLDRYPEDPDRTEPVQTGDMYFNTNDQSYYYWSVDHWSPFGTGSGGATVGTVQLRQYSHIALAGENSYGCIHNATYVRVTVGGVELTQGVDFTANGSVINFTGYTLAVDNAIVIHTIISTDPSVAPDIDENSMIVDAAFVTTPVWTIPNNTPYTIVTLNGLELKPNVDYIANGNTIDLTGKSTPLVVGEVIIVRSVSSTGDIIFNQYQYVYDIGVTPPTSFTCVHNALYTIVTIDGVELYPGIDYTTDGNTIDFTNKITLVAGQVVIIHSLFIGQTSIIGGGGVGGEAKQYNWLSAPGQYKFICDHNPDYLIVTISGITIPIDEYSADGQTITLQSALDDGQTVSVHTILDTSGDPSGDGVLISKEFPVNTDGLKTFTVDGLIKGLVQVYTNGVRNKSTEFIVTNDGAYSTVTFYTGRSLDDWVVVEGNTSSTASGILISKEFVAASGESVFTMDGLIEGLARVYTNGVRNRSSDYVATNDNIQTTVTFNVGRSLEDVIVIEGN